MTVVSPRRYPNARAALLAALIVAATITASLTVFTTYDTMRMVEAHLFECDGCTAAPAALSLPWFGEVAMTFAHCALCTLPAAGVLVATMWLLERWSPVFQTVLAWLVVAVVLGTPVAGVFWLVGQMGDCFSPECHRQAAHWAFVPPVIAYALALIGGASAWGLRHGGPA